MKKNFISFIAMCFAFTGFSQSFTFDPSVNLCNYVRIGRYDLPEPTRTTAPTNSLLAQEVSAVTYNWDTQTLFVVGDGGTSVVQVSKTGQLINSMTLAPGGSPQGTDFYDPEGLTYIGNGQFVMTEERDRNAVLFTYEAGNTLTRANAQIVHLGTFVQNIGLEGVSYDPLTNGYIFVKETQPHGIFQTGIDFNAGTATNGSASTVNSVDLFNPSLANLLDFADVFALSNLPALNGQPNSGNLLVLSQESGKIVNIDRSGNISSSLTIVSDPGNPLSLSAQQHEGLTMDHDGVLYVVSENGGGDFDHPQLWVYAPSATPNQAPTAVSLSNTTTSIAENTSTTSRIKVADINVTDDGLICNNTLGLSGPDASFFEIIGSELFIKAGTVLDFETKSAYNISVNADDPTVGGSPDASINYTLTLTDVVIENAPGVTLIVSEVAPWSSGSSPVAADWFELTNTGTTAVNISGWKFDDNSNSFASAVALNGITTIAAGESVIFIESASPATVVPAFRSNWFGANPPAGLQIGTYTGSGVGLSTGGDAVNIFNTAGELQAKVTFGTSPAGPSFATFNNSVGLNNTTISALSFVGVNDAFAAVNNANEIGSPGSIGKLYITEVAPWSSGNSPVAADWFEVTNSSANAIDVTGWKMDDNSGSFAASVALNGVSTIAPGESAIFIESATPATTIPLFKSTWFGSNPPAGLKVGSYTGSGVGLGTGGDAVNLYNSSGILKASVLFGASPSVAPFKTFDNALKLNNTTISQLSSVGVNGAFIAFNDISEIGSPGGIVNSPCPAITLSPAAGALPASTLSTPYNGNVTFIASGGTPQYSYAISTGALPTGILLNTSSGVLTGTPTASGTFNFTVIATDAHACTSSSNSYSLVVATCSSTTGDTTAVACDSFTWYGNTYTSTPTTAPTHTFVNAAGCDSIVTLHLTINTSPAQPGVFTTKTTFVYKGQNGVAYAVPNQAGVNYAWTFNGTGATINGSSNNVTVDYGAGATSGILSVVASSNGCSGPARNLDIALNTPITVPVSNYDYSFVTVGCNRVDYLDTAFTTGDPDYSTGASTANVYQLKRLFTEISHLNPLPKFLVMTGDIVMGYKTPSTPDTAELAKQLTAWRAIYESHPLSSMGITLITVPGNHETQDKAAGKKSFLAAEQIFTRIMAPYIVASNGPGIGGPDGLNTDQSKLTYSFDYKGDHYIMMNTDPVGQDNKVPYKWISADIQAAKANHARHIFAFGHKPAYSSPLTPAGGLDAASTLAARDSLWKYLEDNNCEAMFSAHEHLWDSIHPHAGKTWQIINGNGGSRVEPVWVGAGKQYYGYTIVNIYTDKTINVMGVGRNTTQSPVAGGLPYPVNEDANPSTVRNSFNICSSTTSSTIASACKSFTWNGTTYTTSGTYTYTTNNAAGCDSIATLVLTVGDTIKPTITAPVAVSACTNTGCTASGVILGTPIVSDNCGVASITNNAPASFPLGVTTVTWTVTDSSNNTATATQTVTITDGTSPSIYITQSGLTPGVQGVSSSATPYLLPVKPGVKFTSILTAADAIGGYKMSGIPDGLGAFDNCDGTFTLLMNHELGNTLGAVRAHGSIGSFVSKWIINKSTLQVQSGSDLMTSVYNWNSGTQSINSSPGTFAFNRFCSGDLPAVSAYYNTATGLGTKARIYMHGEEGGATAYQLATIASGPDAGKAYILGKFNLSTNGSGLTGVGAWENALANPYAQDKTIVIGNNDGGTGIMSNSVAVYVGTKTNTGTEVDKAGLTNGTLKFVNVTGNPLEIPVANATTRATNITNGTPFTLSGTSSTTFSRPEDGVWNPLNPSQFYFVTTDRLDQVADGVGTQVGRSRLWRLNFSDITNPDAGGTIDLLLDGTEGQVMFDNLSADKTGHLILLEDVGNAAHNGKIWQYTVATDSLKMIGKHDPARFGDISVAATAPYNQDEETSGVIDVSDILGAGMHLLVDQAHYTTGIAPDVVEGGQLLAMFNPESIGTTSTAQDTIRVSIPFGTTSASGLTLGTPATADNCTVASLTNNAPISFPIGTTNVTWTATDGGGNTATAKQTVIVSVGANKTPVVAITSPASPAFFGAGKNITVQVAASDSDGTIRKVELYVNGGLFATDSVAPYTFSGSQVEGGTYRIVAKATDNFGAFKVSDTLVLNVTECTGSGTITAYGYINIFGSQVSNLTSNAAYPNSPAVTQVLNRFEYGNNLADNYGGRVRGYICAPQTGNYTFYVAGDDQAGLWLSTDDKSANKTLIAYNESWVNPRAWYTYPTQKSLPVRLIKGGKYYIETLHKESIASDHLSVAWSLPDGTFEGPIPGNRLSPWDSTPGAARTAPSFEAAMASLNVSALSVMATPNPSSSYFTVTTKSNSDKPLTVTVTDVAGRVLVTKQNVAATGTIHLGNNYQPGVYFLQVTQDGQKRILKLVRQ